MKLCFGCSITPPKQIILRTKKANRKNAGARPTFGPPPLYFLDYIWSTCVFGLSKVNPAHTKTPRLYYCGTPQDRNERGGGRGKEGRGEGERGGRFSEELQWTASQQTTAQTEEKQLRKSEERKKSNKTNRGGDWRRKGFSITNMQIHTVVLYKTMTGVHISHAKTVKHVASEKWKDKKKETEFCQIK